MNMTVKELKEKLEQFPDNLIVIIPNSDLRRIHFWSIPATSVTRGVNEEDGCVFINSYEEEL